MSTRWPVRRIVTYLFAAVAFSAGLWMLRDRMTVDPIAQFQALDLFGFGRPVTLTGNNRSGRLDVPVVNLWERPGFDRQNRVVGRVPLPARGTLEARLTNELELDGITWDEVRVSGVQGWVVNRYVVE